jgi:septal ring factor EnvC (AmiA/AmiB activator)
MAMFAKKENWEQKVAAEVGGGPAPAPTAKTTSTPTASPRYGIAETIQLMRTLPADQNAELVVRVVRATLASLDVRLPDIIEDAIRKQKVVRDKIADFHAKNAELEKQLESNRKEIATLEADLQETTEVKDRLQMAEASSVNSVSEAADKLPMNTLIGTPGPSLGGSAGASKA